MARHPELRAAVDKMAHERIEANRAHASTAAEEKRQVGKASMPPHSGQVLPAVGPDRRRGRSVDNG